MSENVQVLYCFSQRLHSQRTLNVTLNCAIQSLVEIYAGRTVDYDIAGVYDHFKVFRTESHVLLLKVAFTTIMVMEYMGLIFFSINSSKLFPYLFLILSKHALLMTYFLNLSFRSRPFLRLMRT